jgi:transcriptional regulator with XRE-family HTH domain
MAKTVRREPPLVALRALREGLDLTLDDVARKVTEIIGADTPVARGTISAIESGARGTTDLMLRALEQAYELPAGSITVGYRPRRRTGHTAEVAA